MRLRDQHFINFLGVIIMIIIDESSKFKNNLSETVTYIAQPADDRCKWWSAILPELDAKCLVQRANLSYIKSGSDLELADRTLLIESEENHHREPRGYRVLLGFTHLASGKVSWIAPSLKIKMFLKNQKGRQDLMQGSGDVVGVMRIALYLQSLKKEDQFEAFQELQTVA